MIFLLIDLAGRRDILKQYTVLVDAYLVWCVGRSHAVA
jgi:hypothetical protein